MTKTIKVPIDAKDQYEAEGIFRKYLDIRGYDLVGNDLVVHTNSKGQFTFVAEITDGYETK